MSRHFKLILRRPTWVALFLLLANNAYSADPANPLPADPKGLAFFEAKIRPILTEHCLSCHSTEAAAQNRLSGGLFLDSREGWAKGGDSGQAIVPGKPDASLLLKSVLYDGDINMPPKGKLPAAAIRDISQWIRMGAPDPRTGTAPIKKQTGLSVEAGKSFWSYRPIVRPKVPTVQNLAWAHNDIDRFILKRLEAKGMAPAPDADKQTLIRRVYFDLTGLPPSPEAIQDFVRDTDPKAYEKLVDRLMGSHAFAERWARHWLDISRYADSVTLRGLIYTESWRYRDYVINSIQNNIPINQIIREQIAGDLLPAQNDEVRTRNLIATTYLTLGNSNLEEQDKQQLRMDVVDEMLDVIAKGLLGQTLTCARCHDHKFDPIPTSDYYALAGILRNAKALEEDNVSKWVEVPLPMKPDLAKAIALHDAEMARLQQKIQLLKGPTNTRDNQGTGIIPPSSLPGIVVDDAMAKKVGMWQHSTFSGSYIGSGYIHDQNSEKGKKTLTFAPDLPANGLYEVRLAYSPGSSRSKSVSVTIFAAGGEKTLAIDMTKPGPIDGRFVSLGEHRFEKTGQSFVILSNEGTTGHVTADAVQFLPLDGSTTARETAPSAKPSPKSDTPSPGDFANKQQTIKELEKELRKLKSAAPKRPMAMSVVEEKKIEDARIHIRGLVSNPGPVVPRGVLQVVNAGPLTPFPKDQSGRLQLADWIVASGNPLTPRVMSNRIWTWLMGQGIVRTVDNFGTTGEAPTHPELLDFLASEFLDQGWSLKPLVRQIVLSRTYQLSSSVSESLTRLDPENRLWGRAQRKRLDAEEIRDAMFFIAGNLDRQSGGFLFPETLAADYGFTTESTRRSIYLPAFRNALPEIFEVFDFADTSMVTGKRTESTVAPQALFMLNSPFPAKQSTLAAKRDIGDWPKNTITERIQKAYINTLGRNATLSEMQIAERFLNKAETSPISSSEKHHQGLEALYHALFASADFRMLN